jgi:hypothetical protein
MSAQRVSVALWDDEARRLDGLARDGHRSRSATAALLMKIGMRFCEAVQPAGVSFDGQQLWAWAKGEPFSPEAILSQPRWRKAVGKDMVESLQEALEILTCATKVEEIRRGERAIKSTVARLRLRSVPPADDTEGAS